MIQPADRWEPYRPDVILASGPDRTYDEAEAGEPMRFLGFVPSAPEKEPLLWNGDNA